MRALLDVNFLIARFDVDHSAHEGAKAWLQANARSGWASCPLTQNGCIRILSQPLYPNPLPLREVMDRLRGATSTDIHEFWSDDISLLDEARFDASRLQGPRQITDAYLLALAVKHGGRLATLDAGISISPIVGALADHLVQV